MKRVLRPNGLFITDDDDDDGVLGGERISTHSLSQAA